MTKAMRLLGSGRRMAKVEDSGYKVVVRMFFGEREVARFPTREQAEWRTRELNERAERNPRGHVQYYVRPVIDTGKDA